MRRKHGKFSSSVFIPADVEHNPGRISVASSISRYAGRILIIRHGGFNSFVKSYKDFGNGIGSTIRKHYNFFLDNF